MEAQAPTQRKRKHTAIDDDESKSEECTAFCTTQLKIVLPAGVLWKITFPNPHMFQLMLRIISGILTEASFFLSSTSEFEGLHTSSVDQSMTCLLSSAFEQRIDRAPGVDVNAEKFRLKITNFRRFVEHV